MTYEALEVSPYDGHAVELYNFDGLFNDYLLTSYAVDYVWNFQTYQAVAGLSRKSRKVSSVGGSSTGELEIEIPFDHPLALEYAYTDVPPTLNMTVFRGHASDVDEAFQTIWKGPVTSWSVQKRKATLRVPSTFTRILDQTIPSKRWQGPCNHLLYDSNCGVLRSTFSTNTTILTIVGTAITLTSLPWVGTEGVGGELINNITGERRGIQSHTGNTVTLKLPFTSALAGHSVTAAQGCDHAATTCQSKFSNYDNFLGFPLVPGINPFIAGRLR